MFSVRSWGGGICGTSRERGELGGIWEASGRHLGSICEASGIWVASVENLGGIWEASGRHLGGIWKASGRHLGPGMAMGGQMRFWKKKL